MGGSSSTAKQNATEELCSAIRRGDLLEVRGFADRLDAVRQHGVGGLPAAQQAEAKALQSFDINALCAEGLAPLHLAARIANFEMLEVLLQASSANIAVDINVMDDYQRTPLHHACNLKAPPSCTRMVALLLSKKADPCMACAKSETPLDCARRSCCEACVQTLEDRTQVWQGWVDFYERRLLLIPTWKPKWLVLLQDRRPNTGPAFLGRGRLKAALQEIGTAMQRRMNGQEAACADKTCPECSCIQPIPDFVAAFPCRQCGTELLVPASLQVAIYDPEGTDAAPTPLVSSAAAPQHGIGRPPVAKPFFVEHLPQSSQISIRALEDASWESVSDSISRGSLLRAIQHSVGSERRFGVSMKLLDLQRQPLIDISFRVAEEADRQRLMQLVKNPVIASRAVVRRSVYNTQVLVQRAASEPLGSALNPVLQTRSASSQPRSVPSAQTSAEACSPWTCSRCTYRHLSVEAELVYCAICEAPRSDSDGGAGAGPAHRHTSPERSGDDERPAKKPCPVKERPADAAASTGASSSGGDGPAVTEAAVDATAASTDGVAAAPAEEDQPSNSAEAVSSILRPKEAAEEDDSGLCTVCLDVPADAAVVPCGHMCGCYACLEQLRSSRAPYCPMCRGDVTAVMRIYRS
eukprot:TRINITY_DN50975_c0_g1_i1.p1 TRINITY_DN50975_c0_g1~~TRINITY_DN50975_c0_g1_i1.p1  ORF type:complete len:637 (-),score=109.00 TRINITY_DN50975_c0_g1_i1:33-1943(-)